jgi:hypothetical protein
VQLHAANHTRLVDTLSEESGRCCRLTRRVVLLPQVLFVPLPPPDGRAGILAAAGRRTPMAPGVMQQAQELVR